MGGGDGGGGLGGGDGGGGLGGSGDGGGEGCAIAQHTLIMADTANRTTRIVPCLTSEAVASAAAVVAAASLNGGVARYRCGDAGATLQLCRARRDAAKPHLHRTAKAGEK